MSGDGPSKVVPQEAEPLDEIILGEDDPVEVAPVVQAKPSSPPPIHRTKPPERASVPAPASSVAPPPRKDRSSGSLRAAPDLAKEQPKRAKMTLRIPDDEISRPSLATTPAGGIAAIEDSARRAEHEDPPTPREALRPASSPDEASIPIALAEAAPTEVRAFGADDTIELPSDEVRSRLAALVNDGALKPASGIDASNEPGWTPYQPAVDDERDTLLPNESAPKQNGARDTYVVPPSSPPTVSDSSPPPVSEEIPVDMDLSGDVPDTASDEIATSPRLPAAPDSEEIRIEESDRVSETGEVEVLPEDLVSVESLPSPHHPPPVKVGKYPTLKTDGPAPAPSTATATALMTGAPAPAAPIRPQPVATPSSPPAAAVTPVAPPVTQASAATTSPAHVPSVASSTPSAAAATSPTAARRPASPLVIVPPVGALAPPPMTDTAANRKKTRPWWEELFNDDFIRTMAKVTDHQIGKEVTFIEESLGCEAGAMILDLACGTGRHAVELATRGYQVVGFDLSLAMLARASDEAQDRNQKINFVQGDMREMTFEETFDGVYSWNTSFGYFDEEKNGAVIARVHKALKKGGQFLLDVVNRDYIVRQAPSLAWFEGDGCICMDEMMIDFITSRMKVKRTLMLDDGRTKEIEYSVRVYALHELGKMLHDNGFRVAEVSGRTGTPGVFFGCESPRTLILAEKR